MVNNNAQFQEQMKPVLKPDLGNDSTPEAGERHGFLPFPTNAFDRIFISAVCLVAIHLLWLRLMEAYVPLWGAMIVSIALGVHIFKRG
jgi:predicted small integral membrane protein